MTDTSELLMVARAEDGQHYQVADLDMNFIVQTAQTPSQLAVHEWTIPPRSLGTPPHKHLEDDEVFYVLEGEVTLMEEDSVGKAAAGSYIVLPRGRLHAIWNEGDVPVRLLVILTPGQLEAFFQTVSTLITPGTPPDIEGLNSLAAEYGLEMHMEMVPSLLQKYQLNTVLAPPPATAE